MKSVDWPLIFVAATSLLGFGVQHQHVKDLSGRVASLEKLSMKDHNIVVEETEKVRKLDDFPSDPQLERPAGMPFTLVDGWWVADTNMFRFPRGIVVGDRQKDCQYGRAVLSVGVVDHWGHGNCPSGAGSVTFGHGNAATGRSAAVTGGHYNTASGDESSVSGGLHNEASGRFSSVSGGAENTASGT